MGTHSTITAALAGLDQEMPEGTFFNEDFKKAVEDGIIPMEILDMKVEHILWGMFKVGLFDTKQPSGDISNPVNSTEHNQLALEILEKSTVLLKNENNLLPLKKGIGIAVIGDDGHKDCEVTGGGSGEIKMAYVVTPLQA